MHESLFCSFSRAFKNFPHILLEGFPQTFLSFPKDGCMVECERGISGAEAMIKDLEPQRYETITICCVLVSFSTFTVVLSVPLGRKRRRRRKCLQFPSLRLIYTFIYFLSYLISFINPSGRTSSPPTYRSSFLLARYKLKKINVHWRLMQITCRQKAQRVPQTHHFHIKGWLKRRPRAASSDLTALAWYSEIFGFNTTDQTSFAVISMPILCPRIKSSKCIDILSSIITKNQISMTNTPYSAHSPIHQSIKYSTLVQ